MKRKIGLLAAFLACETIATMAFATAITTAAALAGGNENPANGSPASGSTSVTLDTATHRLRVSVLFSGLTANATMAHIHCCTAPPNNVGVATTIPAFAGFPLGVTAGTLDQTYDTTQASTWNPAYVTANGGTTAGAEAALANGLAAGQAYLNIHTSTYPAGEIRGFLAPSALPPAVGAIPTLSSWGLGVLVILLAAGTWAVMRRRG